jgi:Uma2 family endonuclease
MASQVPRRVTVDEFLGFEGEAGTRYQLVRGVITAMAPAQLAHGRMVARLARLIGNQLRAPCEPITEAGVKPAHRDDSWWQADLVVTCAPTEPGQVYLTDPVLVIEVLSPSTESIDRTLKLRDYFAMPSVQDVLLVELLISHEYTGQSGGVLDGVGAEVGLDTRR